MAKRNSGEIEFLPLKMEEEKVVPSSHKRHYVAIADEGNFVKVGYFQALPTYTEAQEAQAKAEGIILRRVQGYAEGLVPRNVEAITSMDSGEVFKAVTFAALRQLTLDAAQDSQGEGKPSQKKVIASQDSLLKGIAQAQKAGDMVELARLVALITG